MRYLVREANPEDRHGLKKLAEIFLLCSLPNDLKKIDEKIKTSQKSFKKQISKQKRDYIFVLEDLKQKKIVGSSQIVSAYEDNNCPYFLITKEQGKQYLNLNRDKVGKHQVGGLVLLPEYRGTKDRLGALLASIRYLYMGSFPDEFSSKIEANLTSPFQIKDGQIYNYFWEEVGKKYHNISYQESILKFSTQKNNFFENVPKNLKILFSSLLPDSQKSVRTIHPETKPAYKTLLKLGFTYKNKHHFLDGGCYLSAYVKDIKMLVQTQWLYGKQKTLKTKKMYFVGQQQGLLEGDCADSLEDGYSSGFVGNLVEGQLEDGVFYYQKNLECFNFKKKIFVTVLDV